VKVLVVGAGEAGKSTLIGALDPRAVNLAVGGRTVAMDHATLERPGWLVSLVGVPGQPRFAPVRESLVAGAAVAVWVHRAGGPVDGQTSALVGALAESGVEYMVVVNHPGDGVGHDGWRPPRDCPLPREVVSCNLVQPGAALKTIERCVWDLVERSQRVEKGE
jgi:hypothetical protein